MRGTPKEQAATVEPLIAQEGNTGESMWDLLSEEYMYCVPKRGDIRQAYVLDARPGQVLVDIGAKVSGVVGSRDLEQLEPEILALLVPGAEIPVYIIHVDSEGEAVVSIRMAQAAQDWERAQEYLEKETVFEGEVIGFNRGGALVRFGRIQGFLPASQILSVGRRTEDQDFSNQLQALVGRKLPLKIIEVDSSRRRLILSGRQAKHEWQATQRREFLAKLQEGDVCRGVVSSLCAFGAFVDLGSIDGLVHISELSWKRVQRAEEVLRAGQEVEVYVLSIDREKERIALSMKRLQSDPWVSAEERYQEGQVLEGTITNVLKFGAFAELEPGVEGLIHISELEEAAGESGEPVVQVGDKVPVRVLQVDAPRHRIALSMRDA